MQSQGLEFFAAGDPEAADAFLETPTGISPSETGILVNLGLALMQQGLVDQAERAYRLAKQAMNFVCVEALPKILAFCLLWRGDS